MTENQPAAGKREEVVDGLIAEFLSRTDSGESFTPEEFVSQHLDYSEDLQRYFQNVELLQGLSETETPHVDETILAQNAAESSPIEVVTSETVLRGTADSETSVTRQQDTTPEKTNSIPKEFGRYQIKKSLGQGARGDGCGLSGSRHTTGSRCCSKDSEVW